MIRALRPELLDTLPHDHPDARRSRRDLRIINRLMGNPDWFERTLPPLLRVREPVLEIGAGEGVLGRRLHGRGIAADGLDRGPRPPDWPPDRRWFRADLLGFAGYRDYPAVIGNLVFHHFGDGQLAALGAGWREAGVRLVLASEPARRRRPALFIAALGPLLGFCGVTRHDARVSIAAGFRGHELSGALGFDDAGWRTEMTFTPLGACRMVARRK